MLNHDGSCDLPLGAFEKLNRRPPIPYVLIGVVFTVLAIVAGALAYAMGR